MGVAGVGKTTVGTILSSELGWPFYDADAFHSEASVDKMSSGIPLTEADRDPWLAALQELVRETDRRDESAVLACSSLTARFRRRLESAGSDVRFAYLRARPDRLRARLEARTGHYMRAEMLESQLQALEEPADALVDGSR